MTDRPTDDRTRYDWPRVVALAALTAVGLFLCVRLAAPFLPAITWAAALAIVALPLHRRVTRAVTSRNWAAGLSTAAVVLVIGIPVALVAVQLTGETTRVVEKVKEQAADDGWREHAARVPYIGGHLAKVDAGEIETRTREVVGVLVSRTLGVAEGAAGVLLQSLAAVFILFFCLRDRHHLLDEVRKFIPLDSTVADRVIGRGADAVHATVYGTLLTAVLQGVTGGLLFWALGLPAPVLWGVVMTVLGILPFVGAFLVWVPAAVYLASVDRWGAAVGLTAWGLVMAGPVANYLYAVTAGDRMRMHPVPTLLAFIGGLAVFGVSGMILGPAVLVVTVALLDVWRHRAADGIPVAAHTSGLVPTEIHHAPARR